MFILFKSYVISGWEYILRLYHGTTVSNAQKILKSGKFHSNLHTIESILYNGQRKRFSVPGSLGYGTYTFVDDPNIALHFISKFGVDNQVLQVDVDIKNHNSILDFTNPLHQEQFRRFSQISQNVSKANDIFRVMPGKSDGKVDLFAGIMTELFIGYLRKNGIYIRFVKKQTETFLPPLTNSYQRLGVPNGTEFTIRYPDKDVKSIKPYTFKEES